MTAPDGAVRPRVLVIAHDVHWDGGMERAFAELVSRLGSEVEFHVLAIALAPELRGGVVWHRVRAPRAPFPAKFLTFFARSWWLARRIERDLVHTCGAITPLRADVISVHFSHRGRLGADEGVIPRSGSLPRRVNTAITRLLSLGAEAWCFRPSRARVMACVSGGLADEMRRLHPRLTLAVTPNGVDIERFRPDAALREEVREAEGVPAEAVVALFVGGDWGRKGLAVTLDGVAAAVRADARDIRLWIVGPGDADHFAAQASRLGIADRVTFFGARADTERFYAGADVFVLPSAYETFSLVAHEAAAARLPLVATPVHGVGDLLSGGAGLEVRADAADIAGALSTLADDPEMRRAMGDAGRRLVSVMSWSDSAESVSRLYAELLAPPPRPPEDRS